MNAEAKKRYKDIDFPFTCHKFEDAKQLLATKEDLANTKVDLIKWMVGFWIAQMAAIIGLYLDK